MRRAFKLLFILGIAVLLAAAGLRQLGIDKAPDWGRSPDHIVLSWTAEPATTVTITWRTNSEVSKSVVQYAPRLNGSLFPTSFSLARGKVAKLKTNLGNFNIHTATLTNLRPGVTYLYRVGDGVRWSRICSFTTESRNASRFSAVVFGDSQCRLKNYRVWRETLQAAVKRENPRFIISTGDLVDDGSDQRQWDAWFAAGQGVLEGLPEMAAVGNHELSHSGGDGMPQSFLAQFSLPENGPPGLKELAYSFDYGDAHFVILDSRFGSNSPLLKLQRDWLKGDLERTRKKWKIVVFHRPPYYAKANRSNDDVREAFCQIIEENRTDLVINGHDHAVMRTYPIAGGRIAARAEGTVYLIAGRSGEKTYSDLTRKRWAQYFYNPLDQPTYTVLKFTGGTLQVICKKVDGTILDACTLEK
ncbi:MAG: metallophosphoesterase family protein [Firmicutes bacterium]|nr:metallophosphoesterase family protein [Bacillota bacterium]